MTTTETHAGARFAEVLLKRLTGRDPITARRMREDPWQFFPTFKLFLSGNHRPEIRGTDDAVWCRTHLIPWTVSFLGREDRTLPEKLHAERAGVLRWLVEGCLAWQAEGLRAPETVVAAGNDYRAEQDALAGFLVECCVVEASASVGSTELAEAYRQWSGANVSTKALGAQLEGHGYRRTRSAAGVRWHGLGLLA